MTPIMKVNKDQWVSVLAVYAPYVAGGDSISHKTSYHKISHRHEIGGVSVPIALQFGSHLSSAAAKAPAKFESDTSI